MPSPSDLTRWAPWAIAAIAVAIAAAGWTLSPAPQEPVTDARSDEPVPDPPEPETAMDAGSSSLDALARCASRLQRMREVIRSGAQSTLALRAWALDEDAGVSEETRSCLRRPEVAARALLAARDQHDARRRAEREERRRSLRTGLAESLGVTEEDVDWMGSYVCAVREMSADTLGQLDAGEVPSREAFESLREERSAALADVRERLGEERYASFRAVGGVGMLADVLDCEG